MAGDFSAHPPVAARSVCFSAKEPVHTRAAVLQSVVFSANGAAHTSPGQRPGSASLFHQALKGRPNRCLALSGLGMFLAIEPRALPWAGMSRPFGAAEGGLGYGG